MSATSMLLSWWTFLRSLCSRKNCSRGTLFHKSKQYKAVDRAKVTDRPGSELILQHEELIQQFDIQYNMALKGQST